MAVHLLFERDGRLLLLKRQNTGYEDGNYSVVAGHLDGGETVTATAVREAFEEAGVSIVPESLKLVHVMHRLSGGDERVDFFFQVGGWNGEPANVEPDKCAGLEWFEYSALPPNIVPYVRAALACVSAGKVYSEYGWALA